MPRSLQNHDHEIKLWTDSATWLALKREAEADDRSLNGCINHILKCHLRQQASAWDRRDASELTKDGPFQGEADGK